MSRIIFTLTQVVGAPTPTGLWVSPNLCVLFLFINQLGVRVILSDVPRDSTHASRGAASQFDCAQNDTGNESNFFHLGEKSAIGGISHPYFVLIYNQNW